MTNTNWQAQYEAQAATLEDFWGRRVNRPRYRRDFRVFGRPAVLLANAPEPLAALDHSLPLFSAAPDSDHPPFVIQIAVRPLPIPPGERVDRAGEHLLYTGAGEWIAIHLGPWGQAFAQPGVGRATAIVAPELAARPDLLSRTLLNTILLNFCLSSGFGMLHASCLWRDDRALLLMAPHNTGKSTTALHLIQAGFALVSDSMIHIVPEGDPTLDPLLAGFPVRRIKLRGDMLDAFVSLRPFLTPERVRDETKYVLDLERIDPAYVRTSAIRPARVTLCLLARGTGEETTWGPATGDEVTAAVMANSLFYDAPEVWQKNLAAIDRLLARARSYQLTIGRDAERLLAAVEALWKESGVPHGAG